jgi:peroxiredoxin
MLHDDFIAEGFDGVYCLAVNDAFVMYQWAQRLGVAKIRFLPDGSGHFTRRMGMLINKDHLGFGMRSWRYALVAEDNVITHWFEEPGINDDGADEDPYGLSAPEHILATVREGRNKAALVADI